MATPVKKRTQSARSKNWREWTVDETHEWALAQIGKDVADLFRKHKINGVVLAKLKEHDLREPPIAMTVFGDMKLAWLAVDELQRFGDVTNKSNLLMRAQESEFQFVRSSAGYVSVWRRRKPEFDSWFKSLFAICFMLFALLASSLTIVIVNDRVPDQMIYPPLPDLMLDLLPHMPWAFAVSEYLIMAEVVIFGLILLCHRHRAVLLRRFCMIYGTTFLFRCVTMLVTSLSVPEREIVKCAVFGGTTVAERLAAAWHIFSGAGLSISGVRSCGDYMFSGHTATLTLLHLFILEYTDDRKFKALHVFSWCALLFGVFCVLGAHQHYSIDCIIGLTISSRLFAHYHVVANFLRRDDETSQSYRQWSPFLLYDWMEQTTDGAVPHEFEWPWNAHVLN